MTPPRVTVIIPCRNEARFIGPCLDSVLQTSYPADLLEFLVVDGQSDDGTLDILARYAGRDPRIRVLPNPKRTAPAAMNIGIGAAGGEVLVRMDAHNEYPAAYIPGLVGWLERTGADNVGGSWVTVPADDTPTAGAIALALAHPFGIGNAQFRLGVQAPTEADTVPFGCFRRELFDRIGGFDEELVRNQDDELNFRIRRRGGRVVLVPDVVSRYHARGSLGQLARMYYQYGLFKPLVAYKIGRVMTIRQLVPPAFVALLLVTAAAAGWWWPARGVLALVLLGYGIAVSAVAVRVGGHAPSGTVVRLAAAFATLHFSYGFGFLVGALRLLLRRWLPAPTGDAIPLSR